MSAAPPPPARTAGRPRVVACPNCGGSVEVRAAGISISAICGSCGSTLDLASPDLRIIGEARERTREPEIAIGTRGTLAGTEWEVIGYQMRSNPDPEESWTWEEYLLFNPYRGFRFLAHDEEGWILFCMLRQDVPDPPGTLGGRRHYALESSGYARTDYVLGEFYWRAKAGDRVAISQYEAAPYVLTREQAESETTWSRGLKLDAAKVQAAFKLPPPPLPPPDPLKPRTARVVWTMLAAVALLALMHTVPFGSSSSRTLFEQTYQVKDSDKGRVITAGPFTVPGSGGNLQIALSAPLKNDWVELAVALVRDPDNLSFNATRTLEYYSGYEDGESWSEGSPDAYILFASVPGGSYRLLIEPDAGAFVASTRKGAPASTATFRVQVRRHVAVWANFWLAFVLLLAYPAFCIARLWWHTGSLSAKSKP